MMTVRLDWRRRIPIRRSAQDCSPLLGCSTAQHPFFLVLEIATCDLACFLSRGDGFARVVGFAEQISLLASERQTMVPTTAVSPLTPDFSVRASTLLFVVCSSWA